MERVIEIATDGQFLSRDRGTMLVKADGSEVGRVPLDDISCIIITARGISYSNDLIRSLAERGAAFVVCKENFQPISWLWPVEGNHTQASRMQAQLSSPKPFSKRAWQAVIKAKVDQQAAILEMRGAPSAPALAAMARRIRSGDPDNIEAQAARRYWPELMGSDFRRDTSGTGANAQLNYGYTVLRATTARAIVAAGLHPSIGIHHHNTFNSLALADDLMEPFRPFVDLAAIRLQQGGVYDVTPEAKELLANVMAWDLPTADGVSPVSRCISRLATSLAQSFVTGKLDLILPSKILPLEIG